MASKANKGQGEDMESSDAPLLDLNEASVKKLIARATKRGYITYDELNSALPQDQMSSEQIEDVMSALNDMGVNIVENEEVGEEGEDSREDEVEAIDSSGEDGGDDGEMLVTEKKKETVDRTDDPVRMYLREMGAVELLSAKARSRSPSASRPAATP
jgi:RNA polymerase primary sigma factor